MGYSIPDLINIDIVFSKLTGDMNPLKAPLEWCARVECLKFDNDLLIHALGKTYGVDSHEGEILFQTWRMSESGNPRPN